MLETILELVAERLRRVPNSTSSATATCRLVRGVGGRSRATREHETRRRRICSPTKSTICAPGSRLQRGAAIAMLLDARRTVVLLDREGPCRRGIAVGSLGGRRGAGRPTRGARRAARPSELFRFFGHQAEGLRIKRELLPRLREVSPTRHFPATLTDIADMLAEVGEFDEARQLAARPFEYGVSSEPAPASSRPGGTRDGRVFARVSLAWRGSSARKPRTNGLRKRQQGRRLLSGCPARRWRCTRAGRSWGSRRPSSRAGW